MFIDRNLRSTRCGSEGRNEVRYVLIKLCSAPPNRGGGFWAAEAINMSPLRGETRVGFSTSNVKCQTGNTE